MTAFSHSQMRRPLFEDPSPAIEREHPFDGPHGFLLGGMADPNLQEVGQQYFDAADVLVEMIKRQDVEDYKFPYPVFYLYRHSIELYLKAILPKPVQKHHKLDVLSTKFEEFVRVKFAVEVPDWITQLLKEISHFDPGSTTFRYNDSLALKNEGELHVDLLHLQRIMHELKSVFERVIAAIDQVEEEGRI